MNISDERIGSLAKKIAAALTRDGVAPAGERDRMAQVASQAMMKYVQTEQQLDTRVRAKITSQKRHIVEGSGEWDILYNKYYEEELNKLR